MRNTFKRGLVLCLASISMACLAAPPAAGVGLQFTVDSVLLNPSGNDATLNMGNLVAGTPAGHPLSAGSSTTRLVNLYLTDSSGLLNGVPAQVSVMQLSEMPGCAVKVDGLTIGSVPSLVASNHPVASSRSYQLQITVPANVDPGPYLSSLQWSVDVSAP